MNGDTTRISVTPGCDVLAKLAWMSSAWIGGDHDCRARLTLSRYRYARWSGWNPQDARTYAEARLATIFDPR